MSEMRKPLGIFLLMLLALMLAACGGGEDTTIILAENPWNGRHISDGHFLGHSY